MGKLIAIVGAGLVAAGGTAFGLYSFTDVFDSNPDLGNCAVVQGRTCGGPTGCCSLEEAPSLTAAVAIAGPAAAIEERSPVSANSGCELTPCCEVRLPAARGSH